ncbi:MAG TPA: DNA polymerase III subunit delta [Vampirovibrionales bacterium]
MKRQTKKQKVPEFNFSLYFLHGDDNFRLSETLKQLKSKVKKELNSNYVREVSNIDDLSNEALSLSLFDDRKILLLNLIKLDNLQLLEFLETEEIPESVVLIVFNKGKADKRTKLYKLLDKIATQKFEVNQFSPWKTAEIVNWLKDHASEENISIDNLALQKLVEFFGQNTASMASELQRLCCYTKGAQIKIEDVQALCEAESNLFTIADLILSANIKDLSRSIKQICSFQNPIPLLAGLNTIFRGYLSIKELSDSGFSAPEIASQTAKNPWKVKEDLKKLNSYSLTKILSVVEVLSEVEIQIKTGWSFSPELTLRYYLAKNSFV